MMPERYRTVFCFNRIGGGQAAQVRGCEFALPSLGSRM